MNITVSLGICLALFSAGIASSYTRTFKLKGEACEHCHKLLGPEDEVSFRTCVFSFGSYVEVTRDYCLRLRRSQSTPQTTPSIHRRQLLVPQHQINQTDNINPDKLSPNVNHEDIHIQYIHQLIDTITDRVDTSAKPTGEVNSLLIVNDYERIIVCVFLVVLILLLLLLVISSYKIAFCGQNKTAHSPTSNTFHVNIPGVESSN